MSGFRFRWALQSALRGGAPPGAAIPSDRTAFTEDGESAPSSAHAASSEENKESDRTVFSDEGEESDNGWASSVATILDNDTVSSGGSTSQPTLLGSTSESELSPETAARALYPPGTVGTQLYAAEYQQTPLRRQGALLSFGGEPSEVFRRGQGWLGNMGRQLIGPNYSLAFLSSGATRTVCVPEQVLPGGPAVFKFELPPGLSNAREGALSRANAWFVPRVSLNNRATIQLRGIPPQILHVLQAERIGSFSSLIQTHGPCNAFAAVLYVISTAVAMGLVPVDVSPSNVGWNGTTVQILDAGNWHLAQGPVLLPNSRRLRSFWHAARQHGVAAPLQLVIDQCGRDVERLRTALRGQLSATGLVDPPDCLASPRLRPPDRVIFRGW